MLTPRSTPGLRPAAAVSRRLGSVMTWLMISTPITTRTPRTARCEMIVDDFVWRLRAAPRMEEAARTRAPMVAIPHAINAIMSPFCHQTTGRPTKGTTNRVTPCASSKPTNRLSGVVLASPFVT